MKIVDPVRCVREPEVKPAPTDAEKNATARRQAAIAIEDRARRFGAAWKVRTRGVDDGILVIRDMTVAGMEGCAANNLKTLVEAAPEKGETPETKAKREEYKGWLTKFTRIECDTQNSMVNAVEIANGAVRVALDTGGQTKRRAVAPEPDDSYEVSAPDPDRWIAPGDEKR